MTGRAIRRGGLAGVVLHSAAALWIWWTWEMGLRGTVLVWLDVPSSLLYAGASGTGLLTVSLLVGGLQWLLLGAALSYLLARLGTAKTPAR